MSWDQVGAEAGFALFTEHANGSYNNRTFPIDPELVWRGTGLQAVRTGKDAFQFRIWDEKRPMELGREISLWSPDGTQMIRCAVKSFAFSENTGEDETGHSVNCGIMTLALLAVERAAPKKEEGDILKKKKHRKSGLW